MQKSRYRSNIPEIAKFVFEAVSPGFYDRAKKAGTGVIIGGENYGQGSSREHAALVPLYLGVKAVIAKSFARIHKANLINAGILPLVFRNKEDYEKIKQGSRLSIPDVKTGLANGEFTLVCDGENIPLASELSAREKDILSAGGLLQYTKTRVQK